MFFKFSIVMISMLMLSITLLVEAKPDENTVAIWLFEEGDGSHHHYSVEWTPLYVAEACYKYNYRSIENIFDKFLRESVKV